MRNADQDILLFFSGHEEALDLYETFEAFLYSAFPDAGRRVQKTQITFFNRHVFACVSFARVRKKADLPGAWFVLTLGLPAPLDSERVAVRTEAYPGRWTHHLVISRPGELDAQLLAWIRTAYEFADAK